LLVADEDAGNPQPSDPKKRRLATSIIVPRIKDDQERSGYRFVLPPGVVLQEAQVNVERWGELLSLSSMDPRVPFV
jgi:hypothetical protein